MLYVNSENVNDATVISLDSGGVSIGTRIEERLGVVGISQSELARRVGVRQSTMNSLIRGDNRTSRSILKIARELRTTPAYLTGETDDPKADSSAPPVLDGETHEMISCFQHLPAGDRRALLHLARSLAARVLTDTHTDERGGTLHDKGSDFRGE